MRKVLLERRAAMLMTATVDEIFAVDDEMRVLDIKVEIAQAKIAAFGQELALSSIASGRGGSASTCPRMSS